MKTNFLFSGQNLNNERTTKGFWDYNNRIYRKIYSINLNIDVLWFLANNRKYYNGKRRLFPFIIDRKIKSLIIDIMCCDFHEIVHIELEKINLNNGVCKMEVHESNKSCWFCNFSNNDLHVFHLCNNIKI